MKISVEGADPESATTVAILLHGAGAPAEDFLALSQEFPASEGLCWLAPQALKDRWFTGPCAETRGYKEPYFTVAVQSVLGLLDRHAHQKIMLVGFAEGASLVGELLCDPELPRSIKGAWLASGGLVGNPEEWPEAPRHPLSVLITGSRENPYCSGSSLEETARHFERAGARVTRQIHEGRELAIAQDELNQALRLLEQISS